MKNNKFDKPKYVWVIEYEDQSGDPGDSVETNEMTIFEYEDTPLTQEEVLEEVRWSFTAFEQEQSKSLEDVGIKIISIKKEEC